MEGGGGRVGSPANPLFEPNAPPRPPPPAVGEKKKPKRPNRRLRQGGAYAVAVAALPKPKKKIPPPPKEMPSQRVCSAAPAAGPPLTPRAPPTPAPGPTTSGGGRGKATPTPCAKNGGSAGGGPLGAPKVQIAEVPPTADGRLEAEAGSSSGASPKAPWITPVQPAFESGDPAPGFEQNPLAGMMGLAAVMPARGLDGGVSDSDDEFPGGEGSGPSPPARSGWEPAARSERTAGSISGDEAKADEGWGVESVKQVEHSPVGTRMAASSLRKSPLLLPDGSQPSDSGPRAGQERVNTPNFKAFPGIAQKDEHSPGLSRPSPAVLNPEKPRTPTGRVSKEVERPRTRKGLGGSPHDSPKSRIIFVSKSIGSDELIRQVVDSPSTSSAPTKHIYDEEPLNLECTCLDLHGASPSGRAGHSMVSNGTQCWLFGGAKGDEVYFSDLWKLDAECLQWVRKTPRGVAPRQRAYHTASLMRREDGETSMVVFGGWDGKLTKNDIFVLEGLGPQARVDDLLWSPEETYGKKPAPRSMHAMVETTFSETVGEVRAGSHLVVFGGWRGPIDGNDFLADMHVLDLDNRRWFRIVAKGDVPSPRGGHTLTSVGDSLFMFGGQTAQGPSDELFMYSILENRWSRIELSGDFWNPTPRSGHSVCYLQHDSRLALFGGHDGETQLNDFCTYDLRGKKWEGHTPKSKAPPARSGHAIGVVGRYRVLVCGGWGIKGFDARVYALDLRELTVKNLALKGKEQTGSILKVSLQFSRHQSRQNPPVIVQWYRSKAGGTFERVPGGRDVKRLLTADDVKAVIRVVCLPLGEVSGMVTGEAYCTTTAKEVQLLPGIVPRVKNHVHHRRGEFSVEVLSTEGPRSSARPCTLVFSADTISLTDGETVLLEDRYRRAFQVILSESFASHLVLKLSDEASVPLRVAEGQRDLLALVARGLWVLSLNRAQQKATLRAEEALRREARAARPPRGGLWGWLTR